MLCLIFMAGLTTTVAWDEINTSLDNLPLPSPSQLPADEQAEAISFFESQHQSWLAVQSGAAQYEISIRNIINGQFIEDPNRSQTGSLEFTVTPLSDPVRLQSPAKIQAHLFNNKYSINFLTENVFDSEISEYTWTEGSIPPTNEELRELRGWALKTELFFLPIDFMAKTYTDGVWSNKYTEPKEQFFAGRGLPLRRTTEEETNDIFGGEQQYLFMASPALVDVHYWFSTENGDLRQIDIFLPGNLAKSFRYENYIRIEGADARFPQRIILTQKQSTGDDTIGWEYTVNFHDIELNVNIPPGRFVPPLQNYHK